MNNLLIRADATTEMGTGHIMRCLALAEAWQGHGGKVTFLSHCDCDLLRQRIVNEGFDFIPLESKHPSHGDGELTVKILEQLAARNSKGKTWTAVDGYHFDARYQRRIKEEGYKLLWVDDYGHADRYCADIVLNQNISADVRWYLNRERDTRLLLGSEYVLLRREFLSLQKNRRTIAPSARKVLVTMGGSDPYNTTVKILRALQKVEIPALEVAVVIGPANPYAGQIEEEIRRSSYTGNCLRSIRSMPEQMAWADLSVSAGGSTCWELAFMGLPNVILINADNQQAISQALDAAGAAVYLGWQHQVEPERIAATIQELLVNNAARETMGERGQGLVDGLGLKRLMGVCEALT